VAGLLWVGIGCMALQQTRSRQLESRRLESRQHESRQHGRVAVVQVPGGRIATSPSRAEELSWLAGHTQPGQFLFNAGWPGVYLPLGVRNPIYADGFDSRGVTRPEYVDLAILQLEAKQVRYVLWPQRFDALGDAHSHFAAFHAYLETHYRKVRSFADGDELWERVQSGRS
jgi:hypothetical protein